MTEKEIAQREERGYARITTFRATIVWILAGQEKWKEAKEELDRCEESANKAVQARRKWNNSNRISGFAMKAQREYCKAKNVVPEIFVGGVDVH